MMADSLRPMRIRLVDPARVGELLEFLRRRSCVAEQTGSVTIEVWPSELLYDGAPDRVESGGDACAACGGAVEEALARLGSPRCHDCRGGQRQGAPLGGTPNGNGRARQKRARTELQAHLRAWRDATGGAAAALAD
jgi:hypothetical protein